MVLKQVSPASVTESSSALGCSDDIGEQHGRKDPIRLRTAPDSGKEALHLIKDGFSITQPGNVVFPGKFHQSRIWNVLSEVPATFDG
jgi:hypothetical protein